MEEGNMKYLQEQVEADFWAKGCVLLDNYEGTNIPMSYICACGNKSKISYSKFRKRKKGCKKCSHVEGYSHEYVKNYFRENKCELLSIYNSDCKEKLTYICQCGEKSEISFDNFLKGKRCKSCGLKKLENAFKLNIQDVKKIFLDGGCVPLFEEYQNSKTKLDYECSCGNVSKITLSDFKAGKRCGKCRVARINSTKYILGVLPTSTQQKYIHSIIGGEHNYCIKNLVLDIALIDEMIYIEYDGSGHNLSVKLGYLTQEEFDKKEKRRTYALYRSGWKSIRIISRFDKLPNKEKIIEIINYARSLISSGSKWVLFDIDNNILKSQNYNSHYNFGETKRIRNDCASCQ